MQYVISLSLTLVIETLAALLWGIRGKDLALVALANVLTNPAVVLIHNLVPGYFPGVLVPEAAAIGVEAFIYMKKDCKIRDPVSFSAAANFISYFTGVLLSGLM